MMTQPLRKPLIGVALATLGLLLIPAVAMQFRADMAWGPGDFVAAGVLLFAAGAAAVVGLRQVTGKARQAALLLAIALGLALVWAELAVGLFD